MATGRRAHRWMPLADHSRESERDAVSLGSSGPWILLGVGFGAFIDGIVLHQILQWHHMLSATDTQPVDTVKGLEANTLADGLFHLVALLFTVTGIMWLRRREADNPSRWVAGPMMVGWGLFNLVEGVVDHHLLGLHHVRDDVGHPAPWDIGFLVVSALLLTSGALLMQHAPKTRS